MKTSFIIITYGDNNVIKCINSIRKFYPDLTICIIDNNLNCNAMSFTPFLISNAHFEKNTII